MKPESLDAPVLFSPKSKQTRIPDDKGKNLDTLNEAYEHGRKLVNKILQHVGYDDESEWKVIVSIVGSCISNARCSALPILGTADQRGRKWHARHG
jgi:hypothetical protein